MVKKDLLTTKALANNILLEITKVRFLFLFAKYNDYFFMIFLHFRVISL